MSIKDKIENKFKDMSGSIAKNRLSIQTSYAIKLLVDFYQVQDYILLLDCIEDVSVQTIEDGEEKIYLYQIKTQKDGIFKFSKILKDKWIQKLYNNNSTFLENNCEISIVMNGYIDTISGDKLFTNDKSNFEKHTRNYTKKGVNVNSLQMIKKTIAEHENINIEDIDLSKFYFIKTNFHLDTHKEQAQYILSEFIEKIDENAEFAKLKAFFKILYDTIDSKFNFELCSENMDFNEIKRSKGFTKKEFNSAVQTYLHNSIPKMSELFLLLNVISIEEQNSMSRKRPQFLIDMAKQDESFRIFIENIDKVIEQSTTNNLLVQGCQKIMDNTAVSPIYKNRDYIKIALAYRYKLYVDGGDEKWAK